MATVTVSAKGWVVIPAGFRKKHGIAPGSRMVLTDYGGGLNLTPLPADPLRESQGILKSRRSLTGALLHDRAQERKRDRHSPLRV